MAAPALTLRAVRCVIVDVPLRRPLGTSATTIRVAPLLLIDIETEEGVIGRSYLFCYRSAAAQALASIVHDAFDLIRHDPVAPSELGAKLGRAFTLVGVTGLVRMVVAGLDVAFWDALAIAAGLPLCACLGGKPRPIPAYNSNGLSLMAPEEAAREAVQLVEEGFNAVKLRLGNLTLEEDLAVTRAVRRALPADAVVMADFNQALTAAEAIRRGRALDGEGLAWFEEPVRHDDYAAAAALAREIATPVQLGENFNGPEAMTAALAAGACDEVMPDLARIGGVTGWLEAARIAAAEGVPLSSHLFPEVSAHLLAVSPTCHWLEYVDWASPVLAEPLRMVDGSAVVPDRPGNGIVWDAAMVARYKVGEVSSS